MGLDAERGLRRPHGVLLRSRRAFHDLPSASLGSVKHIPGIVLLEAGGLGGSTVVIIHVDRILTRPWRCF